MALVTKDYCVEVERNFERHFDSQ